MMMAMYDDGDDKEIWGIRVFGPRGVRASFQADAMEHAMERGHDFELHQYREQRPEKRMRIDQERTKFVSVCKKKFNSYRRELKKEWSNMRELGQTIQMEDFSSDKRFPIRISTFTEISTSLNMIAKGLALCLC